ncbi:MAG: hypothetical protein OEZ68_19015 [Gammaproteobacteria bacterium]|nr:hypothetical protein [Gammaproteobacteria bacterium]MDH5802899.1 hypothetical protein [Gammaproteobacteria bacterium]
MSYFYDWSVKVISGVVLAVVLFGCSEEQQNKLSRLGVTWLEGDYRVTYADGSHVKSWTVKDGKVTSDPQKGYYYFWARVDGKSVYVQTPVGRTYIEEIK